MEKNLFTRLTDRFAAFCRRRPAWVIAAAVILCAATAAACALLPGSGGERFDTLPPRDWLAEAVPEEIPAGETLLKDTAYREGHAAVAFRNTGADPETALREQTGLDDLRVVSSGRLMDGEYLLLDVAREGEDTAELLDRLNACPDVAVAEPDYTLTPMGVTEDLFSSLQWSYDNDGRYGGTPGVDIHPEKTWAKPSSGREVVIADIDLGTDYTHEDLKNRMWVNRLEIPDNGIDDDGNGIIDDIHGANFVEAEPTGDPMPVPNATHGTHTAGIANAEANNGAGIAGVAGTADNVKVMALTIGNGNLSYLAAVHAYQYIYEMMTREKDPVRVVAVNDSWGGSSLGVPYLLESMINKVGEAGAVSVIATGNESRNYNTLVNEDDIGNRLGYYTDTDGDDWEDLKEVTLESMLYGPSISCLNSDYAIRVAAVDSDGNPANFSNVGWKFADIAAPGTEILSTVSDYTFLPQTYPEEKTEALCAMFMTDSFAFRVNPSDPYGSNASIIIENNAENGTAFPNLYGDTRVSVNITVKDAQIDVPYLIELPYRAVGLAGDQAPIISFNIKGLEYPTDWIESQYATPHLKVWDSAADKKPYTLTQAIASSAYVQDEDGEWDDLHMWAGIIRTGIWAQEWHESEDRTSTDRVLRLYILPTTKGDIKISLDNIALTRGAAGEETRFGKYDYMNGTSMAAPTVTGAIALLASQDPSLDTAAKLMEAVLNRTRQVASLDGLVSRSALLDLDARQDYDAIPRIHSIACGDGTVTVTGDTLEKVTSVTVDGKSVPPIRVTDTEIVLAFEADEAREYQVRVENAAGYGAGRFLGHSGEKYTPSEGDYDALAVLPDYSFATDGESLYTLDHTHAAIRRWIPDPEDPLHMKPAESVPIDVAKILDGEFEEDPIHLTSLYGEAQNFVDSFFWSDGKICFIANNYDTVNDEDCQMMTFLRIPLRSQLVEIDFATGKQKVYDLPEGLYSPAAARVDGQYVLAGGYDLNKKAMTDTCYIGDGVAWKKAASLPGVRLYGKLTYAEGKLYYTGGGDETSATSSPRAPSMLVWDGSSWRDTGVRLGCDATMTQCLDLKTYTYRQYSVSPLQGGLLFTDRVFTRENGNGAGTPLGDTVRYDTATGALTAYPVYYHEKETDHVRGLVVGDTWRGVSLRAEEVPFEETDGYDMLNHNFTYRLAGEDRSFGLQRKDIPGVTSDLKIILTSEDGRVEGFEFLVTKDGREVARAVTGSDGVAYVSGLPAGTYKVEELPDGSGRYVLPDPQNAVLGDDPITAVRFTNRLRAPLTGDPANPALWLAFFLCAAFLAAVPAIRGKKGNHG